MVPAGAGAAAVSVSTGMFGTGGAGATAVSTGAFVTTGAGATAASIEAGVAPGGGPAAALAGVFAAFVGVFVAFAGVFVALAGVFAALAGVLAAVAGVFAPPSRGVMTSRTKPRPGRRNTYRVADGTRDRGGGQHSVADGTRGLGRRRRLAEGTRQAVVGVLVAFASGFAGLPDLWALAEPFAALPAALAALRNAFVDLPADFVAVPAFADFASALAALAAALPAFAALRGFAGGLPALCPVESPFEPLRPARGHTGQAGGEVGEILPGDEVELRDPVVELFADEAEHRLGALPAAIEKILDPRCSLVAVELAGSGQLPTTSSARCRVSWVNSRPASRYRRSGSVDGTPRIVPAAGQSHLAVTRPAAPSPGRRGRRRRRRAPGRPAGPRGRVTPERTSAKRAPEPAGEEAVGVGPIADHHLDRAEPRA